MLLVLPITPDALLTHLTLKNASGILQRCKKVFELKELVWVETPQGTMGHAGLQIGTSR
jgi:hypothetical protein